MSIIHWVGGVSSSFDTAGNWSINGGAGTVPGALDTALIDLPGSYTVVSSVSNTVFSLAVAAQATLDITAGAFSITNGSATGGLAGTIVVADAAELALGDTIVNSGTIQEQAGADVTRIVLTTSVVSLQGGGKLLLSASGNNVIYGNSASFALDNVDNTIAGSGNVGDGQMALTNEAAGTIDASFSGAALTINTGGNTVVDRGLLEATAGGNLVLASGVDLSGGGTIEANGAGSIVTLDAAVIGGTLKAINGGQIVQANGSGQLDGQGSHTVTNATDLVIADNASLAIAGTIDNTGTISLSSTGDSTNLVIDSGTAELIGAGHVVMSNSGANRVYASNSGFTLDNVDNTISGAGQFGLGDVKLINGGTIDANQVTALIVQGAYVMVNTGLMEATGTGGLTLFNTNVTNVGGTILASGSGDIVVLNATSIQGGTVSTAAGGQIVNVSNSNLDGYTFGAVTLSGTLALNDSTTFHLYGTIDNTGAILVDDASSNTDTNLVVGNLFTTLTGGGRITLTDFVGNRVYADNGSETLTNVNNIISGAGQFGVNSLTFVNDAAGTLDANGVNALTLQAESVTNLGLIESTGTGSLNGGLVIYGTTILNAGGTIDAVGLQGHVDLTAGTTIIGGLVTSTGGGVVDTIGTGVLDGLDAGAVTNTGIVQLDDNTTLYLSGTIDNTGTIAMAGATNATNTNLVADSPTVTLTGGGQLTMSDDTGNRIYGNSGAYKLINVNNTISGSGQIGVNQLAFVNEAGGLVDANQAVSRTASGQLIIQTQVASINAGTLESTNTGGLVLDSSVLNAGGTILAAGAGALVELASSADIMGGTLRTSSGGVIEAVANVTIDGVTDGIITNAGLLQVNDNTELNLLGVIDNTGTILEDATSPNADTNIVLASQAVTLTGGGLVSLSDNANNRIYGNNGGLTLVNLNNTISGAGQIGTNQMQLTNSGIIDATDGVALTLSMNGGNLINTASGQLIGSGAGGLVVVNGVVSNQGTVEALNGSSVTYQSGVVDVNLADGELSGGTWNATATGQGATISLDGGAISLLNASVLLSGVGSVLQSGNGSTFSALENTLTTVGTAGTLSLQGQRGYASTLAITDNGAILTKGGTFQAASLTVGSTGHFTGSGIVAAPVVDDGTIEASGGTLRLADASSGTGVLDIAGKSVLELSAGASNQINFLKGKDTLKLDSPGAVTGKIAGLALGDTIDFANLTVTGATVSGTTLSVTASNGGPFTFQVAGALTGNHFVTKSDTHGGTDIVLTKGAAADFAAQLSAAGQSTLLADYPGAAAAAGASPLPEPSGAGAGAGGYDLVPPPNLMAFLHGAH